MPRTGLCIGNWVPVELVQEAARLAEARGYDTFWMTESSTGIGKDAPSQLVAAALATTDIRLGTAVLPIYTRTPTLLAQVATSMDEISEGRFVLGLGSSHGPNMLAHHGVAHERPFQRMRECVAILRDALGTGVASFEGEIFSIPSLELLRPRPGRRVPLYLAALAPKMTNFAATAADGVILNMTAPEHLGEVVPWMRDAAAQAGRDPDSFDVACLVLASADGARAEEVCSLQIAFYLRMPFYQNHLKRGGFAPEVDAILKGLERGGVEEGAGSVSARMLDSLALAGSPGRWDERLQRYRDAGVDLPCPFFFQQEGDLRTPLLEGIAALGG